MGRCAWRIQRRVGQIGISLPYKSEKYVVTSTLHPILLIGQNSGFNCTDEENVISLALLRRRAWLTLRAKIDEQSADPVILGKLRGHFEERFRYDEQGVPRVWKPEDDIDSAFKKAKDQVSCVLTVAPSANIP